MARFTAPDLNTAAQAGVLILAVDDDPTNRSLLARQLGRIGFAVEFAENGQLAWEMLQSGHGRYGLLLTDCQMPVMDGYELATRIRESEGEWDTPLPIVALSASTLDGNGDKCFQVGMTDFLRKPASTKSLDQKLTEYLPVAADLRLLAEAPTTAPQAGRLNLSERGGGILDLSVLESIVGDDWGVISSTLKRFQVANNLDLNALDEALGADDAAGVGKITHRIKGATMAIGAKKLAGFAETIEKAGVGHDWQTIRATMPRFHAEMGHVNEFIFNLGDRNG
jgi:CheY-like chemotaxis protein